MSKVEKKDEKSYSGYAGDLSPEQEKVLAEFRTLVLAEKIDEKKDDKTDKTEKTDKTDKKDEKKDKVERRPIDPVTDDFALLRFLRARKFDLKGASDMRTKHMVWRKKWDIDNYALGPKPPKYDLVQKVIPQSQNHGLDREGRPVTFEKYGRADAATMISLMTPEEYLRIHIYKFQHLLLKTEEASKKFGKNIETFTLVLDLEGIKMDTRKTNDFLTICSLNDADNYPERLGRMIIINTPWVFSFLWKIVAPFIDAKTKSKISIIYGNYTEDLLKYIPPETLPKEYGGSCSCKGSTSKCIPEYDLSDLRISDMSDVNGGDVDKVTIPAGKKHEIKLVAGAKGASVHWFFRVQGDYNITFRIEVAEEKKEKQVVRKVAKALADQGSHTIQFPATITVIFDNEFLFPS